MNNSELRGKLDRSIKAPSVNLRICVIFPQIPLGIKNISLVRNGLLNEFLSFGVKDNGKHE